jgi:hypothetical protein
MVGSRIPTDTHTLANSELSGTYRGVPFGQIREETKEGNKKEMMDHWIMDPFLKKPGITPAFRFLTVLTTF